MKNEDSQLEKDLARIDRLKCNLWRKAVIYLFKYNFIQDHNFLKLFKELDEVMLEPEFENDRFVMSLEDAHSDFYAECKSIIDDYKKGDMDKYLI